MVVTERWQCEHHPLVGHWKGQFWVGSQGVEYFHLEYFKYLENQKRVWSLRLLLHCILVPMLCLWSACNRQEVKKEKEVEWSWNFMSSFQCFSWNGSDPPETVLSISAPCLCFLLLFLCALTLSRGNQGLRAMQCWLTSFWMFLRIKLELTGI